MNKRRKLLQAMIGGIALATVPQCVQGQTRLRRIGFLYERDANETTVRNIAAFKDGLRALGYSEHKDYVIETREAHADLARLPALAAELLAAKVDLIVASGASSAAATQKLTREVPILIITLNDPVGLGLAASLRRPGGNVTGLTQGIAHELYTKRLDFLRQIVPDMRRVAFLHNPDNPADTGSLRQFESDCSKLGIKAVPAPLRKAVDVQAAFNTMKQEKVQALIVSQASTNTAWRASILEQAAKHRLPAAYGFSGAGSGELISYGANPTDLHRRVAVYADKIFKGAKPGDLPIEQPTKFELIVNMKTAKTLGLTIPQSILVSADKVIE